MDTYAARLASFTVSQPSSKKAKPDPKNGKALKWPHKTLSPAQLSKAGFFFQPSRSSPDNTTCYLCHSNLDGWEEDDDPIREHIRHAPYCGWASVIAIEQSIEDGNRDLENPMSEQQCHARLMTFGSRWPHENKRAWLCKSLKMVEAGWYYCPTPESDDFARCAYCDLGLDGWEPKDNPYEEHQRRSPDCLFFSLSDAPKPGRAGRKKNGRASKASRMSTQSVKSVLSDNISVGEADLIGDSMLSTTESIMPSEARGIVKKGLKGKKGKKNTGLKSNTAKVDESQLASSFIEPEDDDFEVKVVQAGKAMRGKKRESAGVAASSEELDPANLEVEDDHLQPQAKRRRTTRSKAKSDIEETTATSINNQGRDLQPTDIDMVDIGKPVVETVGKKPPKGRKQRASSKSRQNSTASALLKATIPIALIKDDEIDAALQEDLDRPLTDNESDKEQPQVKESKGRRTTRSKAGTSAAPLAAPAHRTTRASTMATENSTLDLYPILPANSANETPQDLDTASPQTAPPATKKQAASKALASDATKKTNTDATEDSAQLNQECVPVQLNEARARQTSQRGMASADQDEDLAAMSQGQAAAFEKQSAPDGQIGGDASDHENEKKKPKKTQTKTSKKKNTKKQQADGGAETEQNEGPIERALKECAENSELVTAVLQDGYSAKEVVIEQDTKPSKVKRTTTKANEGRKAKTKKTEVVEEEVTEQGEEHPGERVVETTVAESPAPPPTVVLRFQSEKPTPSKALSSQSSDEENHPPSSLPSQTRSALAFRSPFIQRQNDRPLLGSPSRAPLADITPAASPSSRANGSKLRTALPWSSIDIEKIFREEVDAPSADSASASNASVTLAPVLTSPERKLTVEEWIHWKAERAEERLRGKCERLVGRFEGEGMRALRTMEGIECVE